MKKYFSFIVPFLFAMASHANCILKDELDGQRHFICQAPQTEKTIHVLDLHGGFAETAYYHAYFMRQEIEQGILNGVKVRTDRAFSEISKSEQEQSLLIKKCVIDSYRQSVSEEFKQGLRNFHRGLVAAGSTVSWQSYEESNYMVEFSIFADSIRRVISADAGKGKLKVFGSCAPYFIGHSIAKPFKKLAQSLRTLKMGCTGISASASSSKDGALVHGRNFDTGLLGFYEPSQVVVINHQKNGLTSVGLASAGLHYAGGISGFNNYGLSGSLHELQTEGTKIRHEAGASDIAPYLLHSILMKARSLNEAIEILKARRGFGAWTFLISDTKTDESASIELSGDTVVVARREQRKYLGQSNHFLAPETKAEGYEYSLNKTLETRARLQHVSRSIEQDWGQIDSQWVINRLSGHYDELVGHRAFGRTTTKVYTAATHVMIPARQEWWMSIGETYPTNRSHFVGFRLVSGDVPVEIIGVTKAAEDLSKPRWYDSMKNYIQAYLANEQDHSTLAGIDKTLDLLATAQTTALENQIYEFPYHFMWARLKVYRAAKNIMLGQRDIAYQDLIEAQIKLDEITANLDPKLHNYEKFQVALWQFRAETLKSQAKQDKVRQAHFQQLAKDSLRDLIAAYPQQTELYDLQWSLNESAQLYIVLAAEIRLGTVE